MARSPLDGRSGASTGVTYATPAESLPFEVLVRASFDLSRYRFRGSRLAVILGLRWLGLRWLGLRLGSGKL